jgi:hypothetical protein
LGTLNTSSILLTFFNVVFNTSTSTLGGYISWLNGSLTTMSSSAPTVGSPTTTDNTLPTAGQPTSYPYFLENSYIWLDDNNNYWAMYIGGIGGNGIDNSTSSNSLAGAPFNNAIYIPTGSAYNTLICQVYGAGGGGGGGGFNNLSTSNITANGGGGGAGAYCCFSVDASEPENGLIELYIPGGGGGGNGCNDSTNVVSGGCGGGGGQDGNGTEFTTPTNFQTATNIWWNSNSLNGTYINAASCPSGAGGMGFSSNNIFYEKLTNYPFIYTYGVNPSISSSATSTETINQANLSAISISFDANVALGGTSTANTVGAVQYGILEELFGIYNQTIQGLSGQTQTPSVVNIGIPYSSETLNNFMPIQSGSTSSGSYNTLSNYNTLYSRPTNDSFDGCVVNQYSYSTTTNPYYFGCGGNGGNSVGGSNAGGYCGFPGCVIFTLTNSTPGNSI